MHAFIFGSIFFILSIAFSTLSSHDNVWFFIFSINSSTPGFVVSFSSLLEIYVNYITTLHRK
ncbi:hypothetical protein ATHSA_1439 [Athalassotoga saccharophila]|nr:hypothetical protein ATHSA_1439 [Athalassotoga saccharophila]